MAANSNLNNINGPELVIGLVAAVGADLEIVTKELQDAIKLVGYSATLLRLSEFMHTRLKVWSGPLRDDIDQYIGDHQDTGNRLRKKMTRGDAMARVAIIMIREARQDQTKSLDKPQSRCVYIVRQLKNPDEVNLLRQVYGDAFVLVGIHADRETRLKNLVTRIAKDKNDSSNEDRYRLSAEAAIARDMSEEDDFGQNVRDTYPLADVFFDSTKAGPLATNVLRFVEILFGYPYHTPTREEYLMFQAFTSSLRSAALSRQVGAAIASIDGSVIAVGMNEAPKVGGGQYWSGQSPDHRDFKKGEELAVSIRKNTLSEVLGRLNSWLRIKFRTPKLAAAIRAEKAVKVLKGTRLMGLTEFGREVHAEMAAILDAARRGVPVQDHILFTTTFPCHNCAKHIIASGIRVVYFMEPYPKSLARILHKDETEIRVLYNLDDARNAMRQQIEDEARGEFHNSRVILSPFLGLAPRRYQQLFSMVRRKNSDGTIVEWTAADSLPRVSSPTAHLDYCEKEKKALQPLRRFLR